MAATEQTSGAFVSEQEVPASQKANVTTTSTGKTSSTTTNTGTTDNFKAVVTGTSYGVTGGTFNNLQIGYGSTPKQQVTITGTDANNPVVTGNDESNDLNIGGSLPNGKSDIKTTVIGGQTSLADGDDSIKFTKALDKRSVQNLGKGADSISFKSGRTVRSSFNMGEGADSVTFKGSTLKQSKISLGIDNAADVVNISADTTTKGVDITDFGAEDILRVGGQTYDYKQIALKDGNLGNGIHVDLT